METKRGGVMVAERERERERERDQMHILQWFVRKVFRLANARE